MANLAEEINAAIERLLGSTATLFVSTFECTEIPGRREFARVAWTGGKTAQLDFAWCRREQPDPTISVVDSEHPAQHFHSVDEAVAYIEHLTELALDEEADDVAAASVSGWPVAFERLKARMRPGDFLIEGAAPADDADKTFAAFGAEVRYAIKNNKPLSLESYWPAGEHFGFEEYHVAEIWYAADGVKHGVRLCRKPGEVACLVGTVEYPDIKAAVAAIAAEALKAAE
jgi:hypothetical protein